MRQTCRVCDHPFFAEPLLRYENMPIAAQAFPEADSLDSDSGADLEVRQCSGCGLVQLSNEPVPYYRDVIRAAAYSPEMKGFRTEQFSAFVQRFSLTGKRVLEIGCGCGEYLSIMRDCGADVWGLEHSEESVKRCVNEGLKVSRGFVDNPEYSTPGAPFSAFYILNFLEHLPDPRATLAGIRNILTEDAVALVEVPNFDMILRKKLFAEFISDHLFYFTKDSLITTLKQNGFDLIDCREVWHDYIISALVRRRPRLDLAHFQQERERLRGDLEQYIHRFGDKRVAIWGAGHQALAIIALTGLGPKIRYVLDSAPFKQGKYTPATHLPIVPPETLDTDPVDAVIVMAAAYSDEVAQNLRQRWGGRVRIAILRDFGLEQQDSDGIRY